MGLSPVESSPACAAPPPWLWGLTLGPPPTRTWPLWGRCGLRPSLFWTGCGWLLPGSSWGWCGADNSCFQLYFLTCLYTCTQTRINKYEPTKSLIVIVNLCFFQYFYFLVKTDTKGSFILSEDIWISPSLPQSPWHSC